MKRGDFQLFSNRLKSLRNKNGYTQEEAAAKLGIARTTYSGYERGTSEPDFSTLDKIIELYGVSLEWLVHGKEIALEKDIEKLIEDFIELEEEDQKHIMNLIERLKKERP